MARWAPTATGTKTVGTGKGGLRRILVQVADFAAGQSLRIQGRVPGAAGFVSLNYTNRNTGAAVSGATDIAANGVFEADVTGLEVQLDYTHAAGAIKIDYTADAL